MANFAGTFTSPYGSPQFYYDISYAQTGRSAGAVDYAVTVSVRMASSSSSFGYALEGTVYVGNAAQAIRFKNNETWSGTGSPHPHSIYM